MTCLAGGSTSAWAGYASMVIDSTTGEVLNEVNADDLNHPASLTKMMTLYMTFDALQRGRITLDTRMPVSEFAAAKMPTHLGVPAGDEVTVKECVLGMVVLSANDCAAIVGEYLAGGSETAFARMMTDRAHALGMTNTTFRNASGLPDDEQVTSARDLVKLAQHLHDDFPQYYLFSTREFLFRGRLIKGHNHLMYRYAGMDGLKTGFTTASGFNLASSAERDGHRLIGVVMGSTSGGVRDNLMATLLDNGFAHRPTDPMLVAEAGGQNPRMAKRLLARAGTMLAALSPIPKAEAATLRAPSPASVRVLRAHAAKPGGIVTAVSTERWAVQVGAFASHAQAEEAAQHAIHLAGLHGEPSILAPAKNEKHKIYRARLGGFSSESQAREACGALHKKGHLCVVVPPGKASVKLARN